MPLNVDDILSLGMVLLRRAGEEALIAFPLVLPMGWTESPPLFCTVTETVIDLVNERLQLWDPPPHPLEKVASTPPTPPDDRPIRYVPPPTHPTRLERHIESHEFPILRGGNRRRRSNQPLAYGDVYVDDEILAAQGSTQQLNRYQQVLFHTNDLVFRPNDSLDDRMGRKEPASEKKMMKGDACWSTTHTILGWLLDTERGTIELPPHEATIRHWSDVQQTDRPA